MSRPYHMLMMLRQVVGDGEPGRLGADEDMPLRPDGRLVDQRPHRDMDILAIADQRIEQRPARPAVGVVRLFDVATVDQQLVLPMCDHELATLDSSERLEGCTGGAPAA